jgi:protein-S-isoprenylcysteine O-methyltransferase Ste14
MAETPRRRSIAWTFVAAQFALLAVIVLWPGATAWPLPGWVATIAVVTVVAALVLMVVAGLGLGRGLTATPLPNEHAQLRTAGLYRYVRHPIYTGLLTFAVAEAVRSRSLVVAGAAGALVVLIWFKARWEEQRLTERFTDYPAYAARTPRFVPFSRGMR